MKKIHYQLHMNPSKEFFVLKFLTAFSNSGFALFPPIYFSIIGLGDSITSFIQFGIVFLVFIFSFFLAHFIEIFNEYKILVFVFLGISLTYLSLIFTNAIFIFILFLILLRILNKIRNDVSAVMLRDVNTDVDYVKKRSLFQIFSNVAWLVGPILFGFILNIYGQNALLVICAVLYFISFIILLSIPLAVKNKNRKYIDKNIRHNIVSFFKNKGLTKSYLLRFSLKIWYTVQYFFIPYFMIQKGFEAVHVGLFIGLISLPLILVQSRLSYIKKRFGVRKIFMFSYALLVLIAAAAFIFQEQFFIVLIIFFIGGISFGFLEVLPEVHFFESLDSELDEEKYISIYSSAGDFASMISKILIGTLFVFLPFQYMFIFLLLFSLFMLRVSYSLERH